MPHTIRFEDVATLDGRAYPASFTVSADGLTSKIVTVDAAKSGTLSTRTNDTSGTLTLEEGHGITTGARIDIYWTGGHRRGAIVGTVSGQSVPFGAVTAGAGDNLPTEASAITAAVAREETWPVVGNNASAILWYSEARGAIVIADGDDAELDGRLISNTSSRWYSDSGETNPIAGDTSVKVFLSHSDTTQSRQMRIAALVD